MDESVQKQLAKLDELEPEHWEWKYTHGLLLGTGAVDRAGRCLLCRERFPQSKDTCVIFHSGTMSGYPERQQ